MNSDYIELQNKLKVIDFSKINPMCSNSEWEKFIKIVREYLDKDEWELDCLALFEIAIIRWIITGEYVEKFAAQTELFKIMIQKYPKFLTSTTVFGYALRNHYEVTFELYKQHDFLNFYKEVFENS